MNEHVRNLPPDASAIIEARHANPFGYLGPHEENGRRVVPGTYSITR